MNNPEPTNKQICIWCKNPVSKTAIEHIIPEPLGCPENFILKNNEICEVCNNNLGHVDQSLIDDFDFITFNLGIPRKKGKKPIINNRGNMLGKFTQEGKTIFLNMENHSVVSHYGDRISAFVKNTRNIDAKFSKTNQIAKLKFQLKIGSSPKFYRALYKIGFESLVFCLGVNEALQQKYDVIRNYVMKGDGKRKVIVTAVEDQMYRNELYNLERTENGDYLIPFRLGYFEFIVDLSPDMNGIMLLENEINKTAYNNIFKVMG